MAWAPRWVRARVGVRVASALSAAVAVALALVVAGAALVFLVGQSLRTTVEDGAEQRARKVLERVEGNFRGEANKNAFEAVEALATADDLVQVLVTYDGDSDGGGSTVVEGGTAATGRAAPMTTLRPAGGEPLVVARTRVSEADGSTVEAVLVAEAGSSVGREVVVLVAMPLAGVDAAIATLVSYVLIGVPILIVVAGAATYVFAGRALRPVEAIRARVAVLTERDLARRVPVPAARDEVGRLAETMNAMLSRLQDAQEVQRRFVADASHELRSPLATIAAGLELMQRGQADASTVGALSGEVERLNRLVDALLLLARADERGLQPRREDVDLDEVVDTERVRPAEGGVPVVVRADPVRVVGDRGQLARVVRNLVDNARRHARTGVLVTLRREGPDALIEVSDDGPGVPVAQRARVFERFVRLDDARTRADGGSGLGLAIVAEVAAAHGGTVEVTEAPGGGALFRVRLPGAVEPEPAEPADTRQAPAAEQAAAEGAGRPPVVPPGSRAGELPVAGPGHSAARPAGTRPGRSPVSEQGTARLAAVPSSPATGRLPVTPAAPGARRVPAPVRDAEARLDPATAPWGIPAVEPDAPATDPHGIAVVPPGGECTVALPRRQPGSAIR